MKRFTWFVFMAILLVAGCATQRVDWQSRTGSYTFDEAVLEMGPPDKLATLTDGTRVAEWLESRSRSMGGSYFLSRGYVQVMPDVQGPDYFLRLTFDPQGRLTAHKQVAK